MSKVTFTCPKCGSDNISFIQYYYWDVLDQEMKPDIDHEDSIYCDDCEHESEAATCIDINTKTLTEE
jgi:transcription elongation factor Elf1